MMSSAGKGWKNQPFPLLSTLGVGKTLMSPKTGQQTLQPIY